MLNPYYIKNRIIIKDKNPPIRKKGANGIYFSRLFQFHKYAKTHDIIMAIPNPMVPSHIPPAPSNFMSPIPIGGNSAFFLNRSKINPTINPKQYPIAPPTTESAIVIGHGKKVAVKRPANKNGNRYASGIIRRLKSAVAMRNAQKIAPINTIEKNM